MALNRYNPFTFPSTFGDDFFEPPTTFFPRDLTSFGPRTVGGGDRDPQKQFWRHPGYEVHEDDKTYTVSIDVPGVKPEDMNIDVEDDNLHVYGARKVMKNNEYHESKFDYHLSMGENVDLGSIEAHLDSGVLALTAPKKATLKPEARKIQINTGPTPKRLD